MTVDLIYGTAWKEELTESCVLSAIKVGYRAIDSANMRKHYNEPGVGDALKKVFSGGLVSREELFIQSKYTYARAQDHRKPYDETLPPAEQVKESFKSSLENLGTDYLDSYLLHGPSEANQLVSTDWEVWKAMEELVQSGKIKSIGISNVSANQLAELCQGAKVKPTFVQNRCLALNKWDAEVRSVCRMNNVQYQGFSLLTNNWKYLGGTILRPENRTVPQLVFVKDSSTMHNLHPAVQDIVDQTGEDIQRVIFRFAQQIGIIPLVGTRSEEHMKMNMHLNSFSLSPSQITILENVTQVE